MSSTAAKCACSRGSDQTPDNRAHRALRRSHLGESNQLLQAKLRIGASDDPLEQEADRAAETVMTGGTVAPGSLGRASGSTQAATLRRQSDEDAELGPEIDEPLPDEWEPEIQRKEAGATSGTSDAVGGNAATMAANAVADGGQALPNSLRSYFEPRFGSDLSNVRLHSDGRAGQAARGIDARAYTLGSHIAFASGEYAPGSASGRALLAHELAHVVQQRRGNALQRARVIRRARNWSRKGIIKELCGSSADAVVNRIGDNDVKIISFETAFDKWKEANGTETENELPGLRGNTRTDQKKIRLRESLSNRDAASVLFHEMQHWINFKSATPLAYLEDEINARIVTEKYHIERGWPESAPGYRKPNGTVDEAFIRKQIQGSGHYNPSGRTRIGRRYVGESRVIGKWRCPSKKKKP